MIKIFVDALCDISSEQQKELNLEVLPYLFEIEGKEYLTSEIESKQIDSLLQKSIKVKTSRPALSIWTEMIRKCFEEGNDIFYIASTSKMTGALSSIKVTANLLRKNFPDRRLEAFDTLLTANAQTCLIQELLSTPRNTIEDLISGIQKLMGKTFYRGSLHSTATLIGNNRFEEASTKIPVILMRDGLVYIDKEFLNKEESLNYIIREMESRKLRRFNITYSSDVGYPRVENLLKLLKDKNFNVPCTVAEMNACMFSYLGLDTISISWVEE